MNHERELSGRRLISWAIGLYVAWTVATFLLEGRILTLLRPEATGARLAYAVIANILVGVVGAGLLLRAAVQRAHVVPRHLALRTPGRTVLSIILGLGLGFSAFFLQRPVSLAPAVVVNAFAQVWVVSVAEILVCWVVLGKAVETSMRGTAPKWASVLTAWVIAAVAFGAYHFAHSPPFNTMQMVGLLTAVGFVTGAFFFVVGELYGTIVFHNFLAMKGVTDALAEGGRLEEYGTLEIPLVMTALISAGMLLAIDLLTRKSCAAAASVSA